MLWTVSGGIKWVYKFSSSADAIDIEYQGWGVEGCINCSPVKLGSAWEVIPGMLEIVLKPSSGVGYSLSLHHHRRLGVKKPEYLGVFCC